MFLILEGKCLYQLNIREHLFLPIKSVIINDTTGFFAKLFKSLFLNWLPDIILFTYFNINLNLKSNINTLLL